MIQQSCNTLKSNKACKALPCCTERVTLESTSFSRGSAREIPNWSKISYLVWIGLDGLTTRLATCAWLAYHRATPLQDTRRKTHVTRDTTVDTRKAVLQRTEGDSRSSRCMATFLEDPNPMVQDMTRHDGGNHEKDATVATDGLEEQTGVDIKV